MKILHVFNRYIQAGGEELAVEQIQKHLSSRHEVPRCFFESSQWTGSRAPNVVSQAARLFYNPESRRIFENRVRETGAEATLLHNIYPVGSPSLYRSAQKQKLPVIQYLHNYRPFSVDGSLFFNEEVRSESLYGTYINEVRAGVWQGSVIKSALCAVMQKMLRRSGWLNSISAWVAISDFMRQRLTETGAVHSSKIHTIRHAWDAMPTAPQTDDQGHYLFLGRLIPEKGIRTLIQAWHELREQLGDKTPPLKIAGDGKLTDWVKEQTAINPAITYLGHISGEQKHEALKTCRALIAPSVWWEPLGLIVYEAYDYAKPVLVARSGGLTETVQHGITGLIHEPGDKASLVKDVLDLESMNLDARVQLGENGRKWLLAEACVKKWQDQFDSLLESTAT